MIDTIIFDFGDVFINLDKQGAMQNALNLFNIDEFEDDMTQANIDYEVGKISTEEFIDFYIKKFPNLDANDVVSAWNHILKDFPQYRLDFIKNLANNRKYKLVLLSNTNELHIAYIKEHFNFYYEFKSCFDSFYLSHEIHLRKPDKAIFNFVLDENNLTPSQCLFIDDTPENTAVASHLGIHTWNIDETREDIVQLFEIKNHLF